MSQNNIDKRQKEKPKKIKYRSVFTCSFFLFTYLLTVLPLVSIAPAQAQSLSASAQKGFALLKKGFINDAIAAFQQALKSQPQSSQVNLGLAIAYRKAGRIPEAWSAYQQVLAVDTNNQLALKAVGILATYRPEWNLKGIEALTTLLELNPNDSEGRGYRALLYSYQGRLTESLADYQIVLNNNPTPEAVLGAAQTYSYSGDFPKALELFNRYRSTGKAITGYAAVAYGRSLRETGNPGGGSTGVRSTVAALQ